MALALNRVMNTTDGASGFDRKPPGNNKRRKRRKAGMDTPAVMEDSEALSVTRCDVE